MNGNAITIAGNLASDPELKYTPTGTAVATLNVGVSERRKNGKTGEWEDAGVSWFRVIVWGNPAEHAAESLTRGTRVMVTGVMRQRSYEDKSGETRYVWELTAEEVGPSLRYNAVEVKRTNRAKATAPDRSDPWTGIDASTEPPANQTTGPMGARERPGAAGSEPGTAVTSGAPTGTRAKRTRRAPNPAPATS